MYIRKDISDLRDLARQRETLVEQMTAIKMDTKRLLNITFPELEKVVVLFTKSMLKLLMKYPSAHAVRKARNAAIGKIIIPGSYGKMTAETVGSIKKAAQRSVGTASFTKEVVIRQKASILLQLEEHLKEITSLLTEQCESMMQEEMELLKSIKGIGNKVATNFLVEMGGDIKNYKNHKKLIAMAGIDPAVYQSGKYEGKGKISKRGNSHLRRVIWLMAVKVVQCNEYFRAYYLKRRGDGLPYKKAVMATAHKLVRTIFAMLSNRTFFNAKVN
jgi:transposase